VHQTVIGQGWSTFFQESTMKLKAMKIAATTSVVAVFLFSTVAVAEIPLLKPAQLSETASQIVTAKVSRVYESSKTIGVGYVDTLYAIEVTVTGVKKGDEMAVGQTVFVKAWQMEKRPDGWAGPSGQSVIPKPGQTVDLYLTGAGKSFDALIPNGIQAVKP